MQSVKEFLYHTKAEKRSLLILICIIASMTLAKRYFVSKYKPKTEDSSYLEKFLNPINIMEDNLNSALVNSKYEVEQVQRSDRKNDISSQNKNAEKFSIDPNTAPEDSLRLVGLSAFAVSNLLKYRDNGGHIKSPEQLNKIYGIDSNTYTKVKKQIEIKSEEYISQNREKQELKSNAISQPKLKRNYPYPKKQEKLIDINKADEIQLQYIRGIGPSYAKRIVKYRELIGGYHSKEQLKEVYGIDHKKYLEIKDQVEVQGNTRKININSVDHKSLSNHPYISYQEAKLIAAYQKKHGPFTHAYDIVKIGVMDSTFVEKIIPYLPDTIAQDKAQVPPTSL